MRALLPAVAALLLMAASAFGHVGGPAAAPDQSYKWGNQNSPTFNKAMENVPTPAFKKGPCTDASKDSMPAGTGHDHLDPAQHRFSCNMKLSSFLPLTDVLKARPDVVLGEMDVKGDLAVVGVAYPESGFLLFDVKDSANPKFLSWYRGDECEGLAVDTDCGAFVDLSPDGKRVYISVQQISLVPGGAPALGVMPAAYPGIDVVDISNRTKPQILQKLPIPSQGGVHTTRSFEVPGKGEYTISVANGVGAVIAKVEGPGILRPINTIKMDDLHDTFIQQDPMTNKTLLYTANGFATGFRIWDISSPDSLKELGEWDPTPECDKDWYSHTLDVTTINGRRIVTLPVELIDFFGNQTAADQAKGCGKLQGNGDFAGPMFIVDATDFSKLGKLSASGTTEAPAIKEMKKRSEATLITTWSNAAGRAGGELTFSPHNQQIVGDKIYLSQYHAGVVVLDASEAFAGRNVRPKELGFYVPASTPNRPITPDKGGTTPAYAQFFTSFIDYRPWTWDMQFHRGNVLAADGSGGFYSLTYVPSAERPVVVTPAPRAGAPSGASPGVSSRAATPSVEQRPAGKKAKTCSASRKSSAKKKKSAVKKRKARAAAKPPKKARGKKRAAAKRCTAAKKKTPAKKKASARKKARS